METTTLTSAIASTIHHGGRSRRRIGRAPAAVLAVLAAAAAAPVPIAAQGSTSGDRDLARIDGYRSFDESGFSFDFATDGSEGASLMRVSVRRAGDGAALVRYLEPAAERGRLVLVRGASFWLLDAGMKAPIRISPRQLLFGQASAGDVTRVAFGEMYETAGRDEADGGFVFRLSARKGAGATYDRVDLRTDAGLRPIEAACRGRSGTLIKTIEYERYETVGGKELLTGFSIKDEVTGEIERVKLSNFGRSIPPDSAFTVQGLKFQR